MPVNSWGKWLVLRWCKHVTCNLLRDMINVVLEPSFVDGLDFFFFFFGNFLC